MRALETLLGAVLGLTLACQAREHEFVSTEEFEDLARAEAEGAEDACMGGQTLCGRRCRDLEADPKHCGECDNPCDSDICVFGSCLSCRPDETGCEGACVDIQSDAAHCGGCGVSCRVNELCSDGVCTSACPDGTVDCNGGCVDLRVDLRNCGGCGDACAPNRVCSGGHCRAECMPPLASCDGICRDVEVDPRHCGGCDQPCEPLPSGAGTTCVAGECVPSQENCQNGEDDNDDGLRDCEDPACAAYRCVPRSPAGWSEPFVLVTGNAEGPPECPRSRPHVVVSGLHQGLEAAPAECSCECTTSAACRVALAFYDDATCWNVPWELTGSEALTSGVCEVVYFEREGTEGAVAIWPEMSAERRTEENTACSMTSPELSPPGWTLDAIGCGQEVTSALGCNDGTCVPRDPDVRYCVSQQGNQSCPAGFTDKQLMHTDFIDDRACGECECEFECGEEFQAFTDEDCTVDSESISSDTPCSSLTPDGTPDIDGDFAYETRSFLVEPPSCDPVSESRGAATPSGSVTVCCESD